MCVSRESWGRAQSVPAFCFQMSKTTEHIILSEKERHGGCSSRQREKKILITGKSLPKPGKIKRGQQALENRNLWAVARHTLWVGEWSCTSNLHPGAQGHTWKSQRVREPEPEEVVQTGAEKFIATTQGSRPIAGEWTSLTCDITERFWKLGSIPELWMSRIAKSDSGYTAHSSGGWVLRVDIQLIYTK